MKIKIKVYPSSGRQEIIKNVGKYKIYLKKPAKDNKANLELLRLLRKEFKKPVKIIKGLKSGDKVVEVC